MCNYLFQSIFIGLLVIANFCIPRLGYSLEPDEVLVVANRRMAGSINIAKYYMTIRSIPETNFLALSLTKSEVISREDYKDGIRDKVLLKINRLKKEQRIAAVVLIRGIPLKIAPPVPVFDSVEKKITARSPEKGGQMKELVPGNIDEKKENIGKEVKKLLNTNMKAAVDSELALVKAGSYELDGWIENPYFLGFQEKKQSLTKDQVLLVCRLDGPDIETVYRIIDDSVQAEKTGLQGKAYFDARWPENNHNKRSGYTLYDKSLHGAAKIVKNRMEVVLNEQEQLFAERSCPDAALYCGWYSLAQYIDSFDWQKGAVGYHIASAECSTLRDNKRPLWCSKMLEKGAAATIGPVYEPYVQGFPLPELFFGYLIEGYFSLGEAFLISLPYLSWQTVLIGDPLYQPFSPMEEMDKR